MPHRRQAVEHRADDPLRRRVGRAQRGIRRLQRLQLGEQAVVLGVRNLRRVEHVVAVGVMVELATQLGRAQGGRRLGRRIGGQVGEEIGLGHARQCRRGTPSAESRLDLG